MSNVSTVTPANIISTTRTAASAAASSTATPYDSGSIVTWALPSKTAQKLVDGTQSYSTLQGQVFTDFASGVLVSINNTTASPSTLSLQEGTPKQND
jgi:hypothetical protein